MCKILIFCGIIVKFELGLGKTLKSQLSICRHLFAKKYSGGNKNLLLQCIQTYITHYQ